MYTSKKRFPAYTSQVSDESRGRLYAAEAEGGRQMLAADPGKKDPVEAKAVL
jgi:hypothetical protein